MDLEKEIKEALLKVVQDVKIHKIDSDNMVLEIDYEKHTAEILRLFRDYLSN